MGNRSDTEVLTQEFEKTELKIRETGEVLKIGRISFVKLMKLMKRVAALFLKDADRFKNIDTTGKTSYQDIMNILMILEEAEVLEALSIVTGKPVDYCEKISPGEVSEIVRLTLEYNHDDIQATIKNWKGTAERLKAKTPIR